MRAKMMKQLSALLVAFMMLAPAAYAGDTDQWIVQGHQDALVIGKVTAYKDGVYTVLVENTLMGKTESTEIRIAFPEYPNSVEPAAGDYGLFSLDEDGGLYKSAYGVYKVDSPDYRTLKISRGEHDHIRERLQDFVNSGAFIEKEPGIAERKKAPQKTAELVSVSTKHVAAEPIEASTGMTYGPLMIIVGIAVAALAAIAAVSILNGRPD